MNARDIQRAIIGEHYQRSFAIPNFTPPDWFECDVAVITKAMCFREYEIKLSFSDFKADSAKYKNFISGQWPNITQTRRDKHKLLEAGDPAGPRQFYFVIPATQTENGSLGIFPVERIPAWAGLIHAVAREGHWKDYPPHLEVIADAPKLHRAKFDEKRLDYARSVCYWRFLKLFLRNQPQTVASP